MQIIEIPAEIVLSVAFGGQDLSTLFVTTKGGIANRTFSSQSGSIFMAKNLHAKIYAGRKVSI